MLIRAWRMYDARMDAEAFISASIRQLQVMSVQKRKWADQKE